MHQTLNLILQAKKKSVEVLKKTSTEIMALVDKAPKPLSLVGALRHEDYISIIAELKQASPSGGVLRQDFKPLDILQVYEEMGAAAVSVVTEEEFFLGKPKFLKEAKERTRLPVLRKDFIIDEIQVYHSRALGADAILLIQRILPLEKLVQLYTLATTLGMDVLVEVHSLKELKQVLTFSPKIVGINNRNLSTFKVDLATTVNLASLVPSDILTVSESGIESLKDVLLLKGVNVDALLIGSAFMTAPDIREKFRELKTGCEQ